MWSVTVEVSLPLQLPAWFCRPNVPLSCAALCLSAWLLLLLLLLQYVGEEDPLSLITEFVAGYSQHGQLSTTEMEILPDLINLRVMSNVIYFTGR